MKKQIYGTHKGRKKVKYHYTCQESFVAYSGIPLDFGQNLLT